MGTFISSNNQVGWQYESGTYATPTGTTLQWMGQVTNHEPDESEGVIEQRYLGTGDRNVSKFVDGPRDRPGTFSFQPQDWKMMVFALGSNVDTGSPSPYIHTISEANGAGTYNAFTSGTQNPFMSFTIEDSQVFSTGSNFKRTFVGCIIDTMTVNWSQGEIVNVDVNYVAQDVTFAATAVTAVTEDTSRPFMWSDVAVSLPSGTKLQTITDGSWSVSNSLVPKHYVNGSRAIAIAVPSDRNYEVTLTADANATETKDFYDKYFVGGSEFNLFIEFRDSGAGLGSRDMFITMSGCKMMDMAAPSSLEGVNFGISQVGDGEEIVSLPVEEEVNFSLSCESIDFFFNSSS